MSTVPSSTSAPSRTITTTTQSLLQHANIVCIGGGSMASLFAAKLAIKQQDLLQPSNHHHPRDNNVHTSHTNNIHPHHSLGCTIWMLTSKRAHSEYIRQHGLIYLPLQSHQPEQQYLNDKEKQANMPGIKHSQKKNLAHVNVAYSVDEILNSPSFTPQSANSKIDLVILYIKSIGENVQRAALQAKQLLQHNRENPVNEANQDTGIAITMLNGVGHHDILQAAFSASSFSIPLSHILAGSASQAAILPDTGVVQHTGASPVSVIANSDTDVKPAEYVARIFNEADIESYVVPHSKKDSVIWTKLLYNCTINTLGTLLHVKNGDLRSEVHKPLFQQIIKEFLTVTTAAGIELDIDPDESVNETLEEAALRHTYLIIDLVAANINSTLSDVLSKRKTENDMLLGTVVKKAKEFDISVPYVECMYQLIQAKETHYDHTLS